MPYLEISKGKPSCTLLGLAATAMFMLQLLLDFQLPDNFFSVLNATLLFLATQSSVKTKLVLTPGTGYDRTTKKDMAKERHEMAQAQAVKDFAKPKGQSQPLGHAKSR